MQIGVPRKLLPIMQGVTWTSVGLCCGLCSGVTSCKEEGASPSCPSWLRIVRVRPLGRFPPGECLLSPLCPGPRSRGVFSTVECSASKMERRRITSLITTTLSLPCTLSLPTNAQLVALCPARNWTKIKGRHNLMFFLLGSGTASDVQRLKQRGGKKPGPRLGKEVHKTQRKRLKPHVGP